MDVTRAGLFCLAGNHRTETDIIARLDREFALPEGWEIARAHLLSKERVIWIRDPASPASIACCPDHKLPWLPGAPVGHGLDTVWQSGWIPKKGWEPGTWRCQCGETGPGAEIGHGLHTQFVTDITRDDVPVRDREIAMFIRVNVSDGKICPKCHEPVVEGMFCWNHRISSGPDYDGKPFELGEDRFPRWVHASRASQAACDGWPLPEGQCSRCGWRGRPEITHEAYGDRAVCPYCRKEDWYSIGD